MEQPSSFAPRNRHLENLLWRELQECIKQGIHRVLLPCGALEAHGAAGLGTDTIIPSGLAERLAEPLQALIAPPIGYGILRTLNQYPGSVSFSEKLYPEIIREISEGLVHSGFRELIFLNGHSGNRNALKDAAFALHRKYHIRAMVYDWYFEPDDLTERIYGGPGGHSGAGETGMVLAIRPEAAPDGLWEEKDAGTLNPSIAAYPGPYSIILEEENRGLPDYSRSKAARLLDAVTEKALSSIIKVLNQWESLG